MMKTGMLVVSSPNKYSKFLPRIQQSVNNTLYIHCVTKNTKMLSKRTSYECYGPNFSQTMINLYRNSVCVRNLDVRVLLRGPSLAPPVRIETKCPVDVVYFEEEMAGDVESFMRECLLNKSPGCQLIPVDIKNVSNVETCSDIDEGQFDFVVLGGTFDRLHLGHKILLSEAILRCKKKLTVGVTDTEMLKSKKLWELIEPCETRIENVKNFIRDVEPTLDYSVIPISDMFGPTRTAPEFQMIVVSKETIKGGQIVNDERIKNGLKPMVVHSVELINDYKCHEIEEDKISSSNDRLRVLGIKLNKPINKPNRPDRPYIIGLCGGIASGKSSIGKKLGELGAGVIDCDRIAHQLYKKGEKAYETIIENFGSSVLDEDQEINRKALGNIVFNDKDQLEKLNSILWPEILERCELIIEDMYKNEGKEIIVLDAAVLLVAGWDKHCHEVWTCIIPEEEAVKRMKVRNNFSEEQAKARLSSQPSNHEQVKNAHVVFCTLWTPEFSQKQVEKAWFELGKRIPKRDS